MFAKLVRGLRSVRVLPFAQLVNVPQWTRQQVRVPCYHFGELVAQRRIVMADFDGAPRELCCHGCAAVLHMVEKNGLTSAYLQDRQCLP